MASTANVARRVRRTVWALVAAMVYSSTRSSIGVVVLVCAGALPVTSAVPIQITIGPPTTVPVSSVPVATTAAVQLPATTVPIQTSALPVPSTTAAALCDVQALGNSACDTINYKCVLCVLYVRACVRACIPSVWENYELANPTEHCAALPECVYGTRACL